MKNQTLKKAANLFVLAASFLALAGCGLKTPPVAPESIVPEAITDLTYSVDDNGVKLTWSFPVRTINKQEIEDVTNFELFRAEIPLKDYCGSCPIPFAQAISVPAGAVFDGGARRKATYESGTLKSGHRYFFKVRSSTSWLASSADSNIVSIVWFTPVAAPTGLKVIPADREIHLSWQPVTSDTDSGTIQNPVVYQVLRSTGGSEFEKIGEPLQTTNYIDRHVQNGAQYSYAVQSMMRYKNEFVNGGISTAAVSVSKDMTAPLPPAGVTVVQTDVGIKVFWDKNEESDLGGYRVYRRAADQDKYTLLGVVAPQFSLFVDTKADNSIRYYYAVTAFDQQNPPNESKQSREATVRY